MSGLQNKIQMQVKKGQVILRSTHDARNGWSQKINTVLSKNPAALKTDNELDDWDDVTNDGID